MFYLSPLPAAAGAAVRGGVPVIFPQFAYQGALAKHGFARQQPWQVRRAMPGEAEAILTVPAGSHADWPHAASLRLTARCLTDAETGRGVFEQTLMVCNSDTEAWSFTGGLHPYWQVSDVTRLQVAGLPVSGLGRQEVDAWYAEGGAVVLFDAGQAGGRKLHLTQTGFEGWQVWNPGPAHALTDLPQPDWRRFLCIEPMVMTPRRLAPGETFVGVLRAEWG